MHAVVSNSYSTYFVQILAAHVFRYRYGKKNCIMKDICACPALISSEFKTQSLSSSFCYCVMVSFGTSLIQSANCFPYHAHRKIFLLISSEFKTQSLSTSSCYCIMVSFDTSLIQSANCFPYHAHRKIFLCWENKHNIPRGITVHSFKL